MQGGLVFLLVLLLFGCVALVALIFRLLAAMKPDRVRRLLFLVQLLDAFLVLVGMYLVSLYYFELKVLTGYQTLFLFIVGGLMLVGLFGENFLNGPWSRKS